MAKVFTDANFNEVVAEGLPVVLDFSAAWCGPCQKVGPIIDELSAQFEGQVNIGKCDVDENDELPAKYGVRNIPTILFIKNGEIVDKQIGAATKDVLEAKVKALLG